MEFVFAFDEQAPGGRELLGGKGIGLAEMTALGVPVPAGFTVTTDACREVMRSGEVPGDLWRQVDAHIAGLEGASGKRFADFVHERIFVPLRMSHSLVHDHTRPEVPRRVLGYDRTASGFELNDEHPLNGIVGSGGVFTTLGDLYLWDQALYGDKLVSLATLKQAFTPYLLTNGASTGYGFGWRIDEYRGMRRLHHGGSWVGFRSHITRYPDVGLSIVILANRSDVEPPGYVDSITDIYVPSTEPAPTNAMQAGQGSGQ